MADSPRWSILGQGSEASARLPDGRLQLGEGRVLLARLIFCMFDFLDSGQPLSSPLFARMLPDSIVVMQTSCNFCTGPQFSINFNDVLVILCRGAVVYGLELGRHAS